MRLSARRYAATLCPVTTGEDEPSSAARQIEAFIKAMDEIQSRMESGEWEFVRQTLSAMAQDMSVQSILKRQSDAMDQMLWQFSRHIEPVPAQFRDAENAVLNLILLTPEEHRAVADLELAVAQVDADPEARRLAVQITEQTEIPADLIKAGPWAVFVMLAGELLQAAPEINANRLTMLGILVMIWIYLFPRNPKS